VALAELFHLTLGTLFGKKGSLGEDVSAHKLNFNLYQPAGL
jgi:hypothetical protein